LSRDAASNVSLSDMRDFVRQHARQLAFVLGLEQQSAVHPNEPARQGERIDGVVANHEEIEALRAIVRLARQPIAERADVLGDLGIFEDLVLISQPADDHAADLVLVLQREHGLRRTADIWQIVGIGVRHATRKHQ
jgi:hypothetical protein